MTRRIWNIGTLVMLSVGVSACGSAPVSQHHTNSPKRVSHHVSRRSRKRSRSAVSTSGGDQTAAPGSGAWIQIARSAFITDTGLTPSTPLWFAKDPVPQTVNANVGYQWLAVDPVVQDGKLWGGALDQAGEWAWWGVSVKTGAYPGPAGYPHLQAMPHVLYDPIALAVAWANHEPLPKGASLATKAVWQMNAGHFSSVAGWQLAQPPAGQPGVGVEVWLLGDNKPGWGGYFGLQTWWDVSTEESDAGWLSLTAMPHAASVHGITPVAAPSSTHAGVLTHMTGSSGT